jgi:hypothetical protein
LLACAAPAAHAQSTILTISGAPVAATPTIADYQAGYICAGSVTWTTARNTGNNRTDTVFVRLSSSTAMPSTVAGVTKALSDFQYNTAGTGCGATTGWTAVPAYPTLAMLGSGTYKSPGITGTIYFRLLLDWTKDRGGATFTLPSLDFFLNRSQTSPP